MFETKAAAGSTVKVVFLESTEGLSLDEPLLFFHLGHGDTEYMHPGLIAEIRSDAVVLVGQLPERPRMGSRVVADPNTVKRCPTCGSVSAVPLDEAISGPDPAPYDAGFKGSEHGSIAPGNFQASPYCSNVALGNPDVVRGYPFNIFRRLKTKEHRPSSPDLPLTDLEQLLNNSEIPV